MSNRQMEKAFIDIMNVLHALPTDAARLTVINWSYEAIDQRPGPLSETGGRRPASPLPDALFAVRHAGHLLPQRFISEVSAREWALDNYKGSANFEIEQIVPSP